MARYHDDPAKALAADMERYHERRGAPPAGTPCECCGQPMRTPHLDHDHTLEALGFPMVKTLRGWICGRCNRGIEGLGDDLAGAERAVAYLKKYERR